MLQRIVTVFIGDAFSKALNIGVSLYLISVLAIDQYAYFTVVFTSIMMGYQVACGLVERLYISDHSNFTFVARWSTALIATPIACVFLAYTVVILEWKSGLLFLFGYLAFISFQLLRITTQKAENFKKFILLDIIKNSIWALFTVALIMLGFRMADFFLLALILATWSIVIFAKFSPFRFGSEDEKRLLQGLNHASNYLKARMDILLYSILAGCMPYIALILTSFISSAETIATYGVAMRYQALFSMVVYAINVVLLPKMANGSLSEMKQVISVFYSKLPYVLIATAIACGVVWTFIPILGAKKYSGAQLTFLIFAACSVSSLLSSPAATALLTLRRYREMLKSISLGLAGILAALPITLLLSNLYGVALACAVGYLCSSVAFLRYIKGTAHENTHH